MNYIESSDESTSSSGNGLGALVLLVVLALAAASGGHGKAVSSSASSSTSSSAVVQQIDTTFGVYASQAERVALCESSDNPNARDSTPVYVNGQAEYAQGLFQIIPSTFASVSSGNVYSATNNIQAAYAIFKRDGYSWREWACKP